VGGWGERGGILQGVGVPLRVQEEVQLEKVVVQEEVEVEEDQGERRVGRQWILRISGRLRSSFGDILK